MIQTFSDKSLEECWRKGKCKKVRGDLKRRVLMKLDSMDAAIDLDDLRYPPSNHFHELKGNKKGYWAISVNGPWRLVLRVENNDIYDITLEQYH